MGLQHCMLIDRVRGDQYVTPPGQFSCEKQAVQWLEKVLRPLFGGGYSDVTVVTPDGDCKVWVVLIDRPGRFPVKEYWFSTPTKSRCIGGRWDDFVESFAGVLVIAIGGKLRCVATDFGHRKTDREIADEIREASAALWWKQSEQASGVLANVTI